VSFPERIASFPVLLRTFTLADAPRVAELCGDWDVARMTARVPHPYTLEMAETFIGACREACATGATPTYAITRADDGVLVGAIGISNDVIEDGESIGYWIGRPHWGNGYATAAARAMLALAFSRLDLDVLTAIHLVRNPGSGRVMAKCGMSEVRREMRSHRGEVEEFRVWQIDAAAWERAAQRG
jgi:RimJ/RimL family protein N-acetyltransferase